MTGQMLPSIGIMQGRLVPPVKGRIQAFPSERWRDEFVPGGFRMFLDRGANFTDCYYDYPTTFTAPGYATLFTGANPSGGKRSRKN